MEFVPVVDVEVALADAVAGLSFNYTGILERFGRDLFFLDGDALLVLILEELAGAVDFQLLPVVFRVEHALSRLSQLGAQFRVFFLGAYGRLGWTGQGALARAVLISRLSSIPTLHVDAVAVDFPWDPAWTAYKQLYRPSMIVTRELVPATLPARPALATLMRWFVLHELSDCMAVAFLTSPNEDGRVDFCQDDLYAFTAQSLQSSAIRKTKALLLPAVPQLTERYGAAAADAAVAGAAIKPFVERALARFGPGPVAVAVIGAAAYATSAEVTPAHLDWIRLFLSAAVLTQSSSHVLTVRDRGYSPKLVPIGEPIPEEESEGSLASLAHVVAGVSEFAAAAVSVLPSFPVGLCDLVDARLLRVLRLAVEASAPTAGGSLSTILGLPASAGSVVAEIEAAWALVASSLPGSIPAPAKGLLPLVQVYKSNSASAFLQALAKEAAVKPTATVSPQSVPFFEAVASLGREAATPGVLPATPAAGGAGAPAAAADALAFPEFGLGGGLIDWDSDVLDTSAVPSLTVVEAAAPTVTRPWLECAAATMYDSRHGLLKITDPLALDFKPKKAADHAADWTMRFLSNERALKAQSMIGGYIQTTAIMETERHPWPWPITSPQRALTDAAPAPTGVRERWQLSELLAAEDADAAAAEPKAAKSGKAAKKPAGGAGGADGDGIDDDGGKPAKSKPKGKGKPGGGGGQKAPSKEEEIILKNLKRKLQQLLDETKLRLDTVMEAVTASETVAHYERALVELDRFKASDALAQYERVTKEMDDVLSSRKQSVTKISDLAQPHVMLGMLLDVELKRVHLTRLIWSRDVGVLKLEVSKTGRAADPVKRKIATDKEALAAAALYVAADNARKQYYGGSPDKFPAHGLHKEIVQSFVQLGFLLAAETVALPPSVRELPPLKEVFDEGPMNVVGIDFRFRTSPALFQLAHMGPDMPRSVGSSKDPRVSFPPDAWQRELLDAVDARRSALVSAPTSSGKTFVSFYIMELVLKEFSFLSPKELTAYNTSHPEKFPSHMYPGVVLYVGPNRYLVRQVAAEVQARFSKRYSQAGMEMIGVITPHENAILRDNLESCQILITEPYCVEVLMTSPHFRRLMSRVRYIIFDEVHNIVGKDGKVWENLLIMTNAPFVALSATVGNPEEFGDWLNELERSRGRQSLKVVSHKERYNDLKPYVWGGAVPVPFFQESIDPVTGTLRKQQEERNELGQMITVKYSAKAVIRGKLGMSLLGVNEVTEEMLARSSLKEINPVGLLNLDTIDFSKVPRNVLAEVGDKAIEMLPEDCPVLYFHLCDAAKVLGREDVSAALAALQPDLYFPRGERIGMSKAHEYGRQLMAILFQVAQINRDLAQSIIDKLGSSCAAAFQHIADSLRIVEPNFYNKMELFPLLRDLTSRKMLPAIVFHLDPLGCEKFAKFLLDELVRQEQAQRAIEGWDAKLRAADTRREEIDRKVAELKRNPLSNRPNSKVAKEIDDLEAEKYLLPNDYDIDMRFTFTSEEIKPKVYEIAQITNSRSLTAAKIRDTWRLHALMRGIGFHHNTASTVYRNAVEYMFRKKQLSVVFAESTLAQGIHMPCPTVVFFGDSEELNATTYRQMSGRAGRRGFDKRGNVVFAGVPLHKVVRLLNSKLPPLIGTEPIDSHMILRTLMLHDEPGLHETVRDAEWVKKAKDEAIQSTHRLLSYPFLARVSPEASLLQHNHMRFTAELLRRLHLLSPTGELIDVAGLPIHLFHDRHARNSASFLFTCLLRRGIFDELSTLPKAARVQKLLTLLSYLFQRLPVHPTMRAKHAVGTARFILYPEEVLPAARAYADDHNAKVRGLFVNYMKDYVLNGDHAPGFNTAAFLLPLSSAGPTTDFPCVDRPAVSAGAVGLLQAASKPAVLRSPLVAIRGTGDDFASVQQLANELRGGLFVSPAQVPVFDEGKWVLNRYVLDFYSWRSLRALEANGLSLNDSRDRTSAFLQMLYAIGDALCRVDGVFQRAILDAYRSKEKKKPKTAKPAPEAAAAASSAAAALEDADSDEESDDSSEEEDLGSVSESMLAMFLHVGLSFQQRLTHSVKRIKNFAN